MVTVTFVKIGYIGTTTLIEALLDERSSRTDLTMRVISSGVKMDVPEAETVSKMAAAIDSDLYVVITPNAALKGPKKAREVLKSTGKPVIAISDEPSRKSLKKVPEEGMGYIVIYGDPMIGATTAFLDPVEMAIFNSDVLKVLSVTGIFRLIQQELDRVIDEIKEGKKPTLPELVITKKKALAASDIQNPYAYGKAMAAFEMSRKVASLTTEALYKTKDRDETIHKVTAAHELIREAAKLADEAREIEKANDSVVRIAHYKSGERRRKTELFGKYEK
ncbi:F420-dependent methylenetetrahydromethanopterin dehydrogenase [Candidatus Bathyarchaeota archaeon]|nr:F420-dependent methylenetetrahydromethanopterin dehydrogenase [Candidatus Bathyarchaeota archaeon]